MATINFENAIVDKRARVASQTPEFTRPSMGRAFAGTVVPHGSLNGCSDRPIVWDAFPQQTGTADMDWAA